jgi:hypothetical protein
VLGVVSIHAAMKGERAMISSLVAVLLCLGLWCANSQAHVVGGDCHYRNYRASARIAEVTRVGESADREDLYAIRYTVSTVERIEEGFARVTEKLFLLSIQGEESFRSRFLDSHGLRVGAAVPCVVKVIQRGACTPVIIEFPTLTGTGPGS